MSYPVQNFTNINDLLNYINSQWITNGMQKITGVTGNNVVNALAQFIIQYGVNTQLAAISSSAGSVALAKPVTLLVVPPSSVQWPDNVQNEYYIVNATGSPIPLAGGYTFVDQYGTVQSLIGARDAVHIAKATNGNWFRINNAPDSSGGTGLPPQSGHAGQVLFTDGSAPYWGDPVIEITSADFGTSQTLYSNPNLINNRFAILWDDLPKRIYTNLSNPTYPASDWKYDAGGGFQILIPGFNAQANQYRLTLFLKGANS